MLKQKLFKSNIKLSSIVFFGIIIQIIATQGILTYNFFNLLGAWEIKKIFHSIGVFFIIFPVIEKLLFSKNIKLNPSSILLFGYLLIQYVYLVLSKSTALIQLFYSFREVVLIFFLISSYQLFNFNKKQFKTISKLLLILTVINLFFVILTQYLGPDVYMKLLTGRYYWPLDPVLKFKISTFLGGIIRSPGLIGESASVGFFGIFSFFFIIHSKYKKFFWLPILLVILSFTRSAYLVLLLYGLLLILNIKKYFILSLKILPILIAIIVYFVYSDILDLQSFWMRVNYWSNQLNLSNNPFFGGALNNIGAGNKNFGFASVIDSYWIYLYYGIGLIGISFVLFYLHDKFHFNKKVFFFTFSILISGFFISFNQSIPFLVLFPLLSIKNWWNYE